MKTWRALPVLAAVAFAPGLATAETARGSLSVALAAEPTTADPVRYAAGVDTYLIGNIFEQLLRSDASGKQLNRLAETWTPMLAVERLT